MLIFATLTIAGALQAPDPVPPTWAPCRALVQSDGVALELEARLVKQLKLDRTPAESGGWLVYRLLIEPDFSYGSNASPSESALSVYLPESGAAIVDLTEARFGIRAANSRTVRVSKHTETFVFTIRERPSVVPVVSSRGHLSRDLAVELQHSTFAYIARAQVPAPGHFEIRTHSTTYSLLSFEVGPGTRCASANLHAPDFESSPIGQLASALRALATGAGDAAVLDGQIHAQLQRIASEP